MASHFVWEHPWEGFILRLLISFYCNVAPPQDLSRNSDSLEQTFSVELLLPWGTNGFGGGNAKIKNMLASVIDENTWKYTSKNKKEVGYYSILYLCSISIILESVRKALVFGLF